MKSLMEAIKKRISPRKDFTSNVYWDDRYRTGGNSGPGSYGHLATFKADALNRFVIEQDVASVVEFGCGDGNQLALANYPKYTGYDISPVAVETCRELFKHDATKDFFSAADYDGRKAHLAMSLDVIFHLTEDDIFDAYMRRLFNASTRYVVIYSSDQDEPIKPVSIHVRHRRFSAWIEREFSDSPRWILIARVSNPYPYNGDSTTTSFSDFFCYEKQ